MVRRIPPGKISYFEPVPPRLARITVIECIFEVGPASGAGCGSIAASSTPAR